MQDRYLARRKRRSLPLTLPNGLRVIRMFCDWGREWPFWENFSDDYTVSAEDLGLNSSLSADVRRWNHDFQGRNETDIVPDEWLDRGWELYQRVQSDLDGVAEVRPGHIRPRTQAT